MRKAIVEVRIEFAIELDWMDVPEKKAEFVLEKIESALNQVRNLNRTHTNVRVRRNKPTLLAAKKQWSCAVFGGWAKFVALEPVVYGQPFKKASTIEDAVNYYLNESAVVHLNANDFVVLRRKSGDYIAIGEHEGSIRWANVLGKLAKSPRQKPRASDSR